MVHVHASDLHICQDPLCAGLKLLQRMGWRQGKGVGPGRDDSSQPPAESSGARKASKWGRVAGVAAENTPVYLPPAKTDVHGLGFDPFKVRDADRHSTYMLRHDTYAA